MRPIATIAIAFTLCLTASVPVRAVTMGNMETFIMAGAPNEAAATSHGEMIGALALQLGQRPVTHSLHKNSQHRVWFNDGQDVAPASFQLRDYVNSSDLAEAFVTRREAARVDQDEIAVGTETNSLYDGGVSAVIGRWLGLDD